MSAKSVLFLPLVLIVVWAAEAPKAWTPELQMKVQTVGDVIPSPDGRWAAWTQTRPVMDGEKSESLTQVFLGRTDGSEAFQLTQGEKGSTAPRFSPDGRSVLFASERSGKRNLYRIAIDGGESEALTDWKGVLGNYEVSPNGRWIAFAAAESDGGEEKAKREKLDYRVIGESPKDQSLWLIPMEPDSTGKRTPRKLAAGPYHVGAFTWSPDGRRIAFETRPTPDADDGRKADISEVEVESGQVHAVAVTGATESQPHYSPDGRYLAYVRGTDPPSSILGSRIVLLARDSGKLRELPPTADEQPNLLAWAGDSKNIYYLEPRGTRLVVYRMPVDGPPVIQYSPARGTIGFQAHLNTGKTHLGFTQQSVDEPVEAWALDISAAKPTRVSSANTGLVKPPLGETRVVRWKSKNGQDVEGLLTLPVNYDKSKKCPLILNIHGGPAGAFSESFIGASGLYPIATFASRGYAVLRPNPRGSVGYGRPFRAANLNDWGGGDFDDLMRGVDYVVDQGIADPDRLAVMGWSYGGYMTNWVITHTTRFKAAATGAGLSNLISMWGTNDIAGTLDDYFSGPWYEQPARYVEQSPLAHIKTVTTPTLILHGEQDIRVPTSQGYEMYSALKRRGVPTTMVVYPRTPHGPREPKFVLDIMQRHVDWVEKHIGAGH